MARVTGRTMVEGFHDAFESAVAGHETALDAWLPGGDAARAGLAVYRNTIAKARADALAALFPTVERLVGSEWFREAALAFASGQPPTGPVMDDYGQDFAAWLREFRPARGLPFLAPIARLDRAWGLAHTAGDAPPLDAGVVAGIDPKTLFAARAIPHPSLQLFWFDWTVASIWLANRPEATPGAPVAWEEVPEGLLIVRPAMTVTYHRLSRAEWTFLRACCDGAALGTAAAGALKADSRANLSQIFARLLKVGALSRLEPEPDLP